MGKKNGNGSLDLFSESIDIDSIDTQQTLRKYFSNACSTRVNLLDGDEVVAVVVTPEDAERVDWAKRVIARIAELRSADDELGGKARELLGGQTPSSGSE